MNRLGAALVWFFLLVWIALVAKGFLVYIALEPTDSGFTRGLNRVIAFLRWEAYALAVALLAFVAGRSSDAQGVTRFLSRTPLWISGGFFAI
ncbi:MAG: hypothetical protein ACX939_01005, partial [Hyphococcus sp.]